MGMKSKYVVEVGTKNQHFIFDPTEKEHFNNKVITVLGQTGEVYGNQISWFEVEEFDIYWSEQCISDYDDNPGIKINPDWIGFSAYDDGIYYRHSNPKHNSFRILQILGYKELGQQTSKDREAKLKFERLKKENKELRAKFALEYELRVELTEKFD
jgi:hypothetical protein